MELAAESNYEVERVVVLVNPNSTRAKDAHIYIEELESSPKYGKHLLTIESQANPDANSAELNRHLREGDALIVAGGDGTLHGAALALTTGDLADKGIPILPVGCGNGNDLAHMLNGKSQLKTLSSILNNPNKKIPINPINGSFRSAEDNTYSRIGAYCAGFGWTAKTASRLNETAYREQPFYSNVVVRHKYEAQAIRQTYQESSEFTIEVKDEDKAKNLFELTIGTGERLAKYGRLPVQLTEERLFVTHIPEKNPFSAIKWLGRLVCWRAIPMLSPPVGHYITKDSPLSFTTRQTAVPMHFDAESELLLPDTEVNISIGDQPYYILGTLDH